MCRIVKKDLTVKEQLDQAAARFVIPLYGGALIHEVKFIPRPLRVVTSVALFAIAGAVLIYEVERYSQRVDRDKERLASLLRG